MEVYYAIIFFIFGNIYAIIGIVAIVVLVTPNTSIYKKKVENFLHLYPQKFGDLQMYTLNKFCERLRLLDCKDTHF